MNHNYTTLLIPHNLHPLHQNVLTIIINTNILSICSYALKSKGKIQQNYQFPTLGIPPCFYSILIKNPKNQQHKDKIKVLSF
jgi:hypothetical protein